VRVWTRDGEMASRVAPVVSLLVLATALHGVMTMPYVLQLANGMTSLSLRVNTILIVILVPLEIVLALSYGAIGGAMAWLAFHVFNLVLGTGMTHRYLLRGLATRWVFNDVAVPLLVSFSVAAMGHEAVQASALPPWARLACGGAIALLAFALCLVVFPALRSTVVENLPWVKRVSAS
ncbi:MAG TPA: polysaccharide biosynthesis protein, partial [Thermoanaerobaculia bacterium]|nr:polysaccharide biosynthesis protein [Thermoanaerobaculia bacterium]